MVESDDGALRAAFGAPPRYYARRAIRMIARKRYVSYSERDAIASRFRARTLLCDYSDGDFCPLNLDGSYCSECVVCGRALGHVLPGCTALLERWPTPVPAYCSGPLCHRAFAWMKEHIKRKREFVEIYEIDPYLARIWLACQTIVRRRSWG